MSETTSAQGDYSEISKVDANTGADAAPGDYENVTIPVGPGKYANVKRYKTEYKKDKDKPSLQEKIDEAEAERDDNNNGVPDKVENREAEAAKEKEEADLDL